MYDRAVWFGKCTGVRVAPRFVLTAFSCAAPGDTARFYLSGPATDPSRSAIVVAVHGRPGTDSATNDRIDETGDFADLAVVELDRDITTGASSAIAWTYAGNGFSGYKVGVEPEGESDKFGILRATAEPLASPSDTTGIFRTKHTFTDPGAAFYAKGRLTGIMSAPDGPLGRFTSTVHHLPWILEQIHYRWVAGPAVGGRALTGSAYETFTGAEVVCQYACEQASACVAYDYVASSSKCTLLSTLTGAIDAPEARSASRWALRNGSSRGGDPVGSVRADGTPAVVHRLSGGGLSELRAMAGAWGPASLPASTAGRPAVYTRSDGKNAVVYRNASTRHIVEILEAPEGWVETDLTNATAGPDAAGDPAAYVRDDGVSAVVYRSTDSRIIELTRTSAWEPARDLTKLTNGVGDWAPVGDPSAYVRSDHYSSIVYRSADDHIVELYYRSGVYWKGDPLDLAMPAKPTDEKLLAVGTPYGYVRHDGVNAVVYRATDNSICELRAGGATGWTYSVLDASGVAPAAGNPFAYVRSDATSAVVFRTTTNRILELSLAGIGPWGATDLTNAGGAAPISDPTAYVRPDAFNAVLFRSAGNHVSELASAGAGWVPTDLTAVSGEIP
ncbi:MAG: hypothetical protein QM702_21220 [Rubrivivax sp.]